MHSMTRAAARLLFVALLLSSAPALALGDGDGFVAALWDRWTVDQAVEANALAAEAGARQVSYLVHLRQATWDASSVRWLGAAPDVPFEAAPAAPTLAAAIADARARGLAVTLVPFLGAEVGGGDRGASKRHFFWPRNRPAWFSSYGRRIRELGRFAERHGVDELLVASELSLLYLDQAGWRRVIAEARGVFPGHLTLGAFWLDYATVRFWDALDSIGVSAYFPIALWKGASVDALTRAWRLHRLHLLAVARRWGKPITFTEVGYPATPVGATRPWDYDGSRPLDLDTQARCYEAFRRVWAHEPALRRFSIWGLSSLADDRASGLRGWVTFGKPADAIVGAMFAERGRLQ